jgi:hypothetical protein
MGIRSGTHLEWRLLGRRLEWLLVVEIDRAGLGVVAPGDGLEGWRPLPRPSERHGGRCTFRTTNRSKGREQRRLGRRDCAI